MRSVLLFVLVVLVALPASGADDARAKFEDAADRLPFLAGGDLLYDRALTARATPDLSREYNQALAELLHAQPEGNAGVLLLASPRWTSADVSPLLRHANPKVRTLAMVWLFANEGPAALPGIAGLVEDGAETFPAPQPFASPYLPGEDVPKSPLKPQSVGDVARQMANFYMQRSGYYYGVEGISGQPGFEHYWEQRRERAYCLSWFEASLDRATQGTFPLPHGAESKVHALRHDVDRLPPVDREITLLGLFAERDDLGQIVPDPDLIFAGRRLGPERLLRLLRNEPVTDDPDLPHYRDRIRDFILGHSAELLRPEDAPWLLSQGRSTRRAAWFLAAAELRPEAASATLREAFQTCDFLDDERARTATALWRLAGPENEDFLVEWFWADEEPKLGRAPYRAGFLDFLTARFDAVDRALLARMIQEERFGGLDWQTLESLLHGLNRNLLHPVVPPAEIAAAGHPLGKTHFHGMIQRAREEYPRETALLLTRLESWREQVRRRSLDWAPATE